MENIQVLQCISSLDLSIGGPARSLPTMCVGTQNKGIINEILTYESRSPNIEKFKKGNISIYFVEMEKSFRGRLLSLNYLKSIRQITCDIIHTHNLWSPSMHWAAFVGRQKNIPLIISPRGTLEDYSLARRGFKKRLALWIYQFKDLNSAACLHATSQSEVDNFRKLGLIAPIALIPNGIETSNYPLKTTQLKKAIKTILFLSRIHPTKGIQILLEAWSGIDATQRKGWQLIIAGEGEQDYVRELQDLIQLKYSGSDISYVGPKYGKEKVKTYHQADVFVLPTHSENFGMVIAEAMSCGLPVITTTGTPWEVLNKELAGWWVQNSVENIQNAIKHSLSLSDMERTNMGYISRKIIEKDYSIEIIANKYKELYKWVLNTSKPAPKFITK